VAGEHGNVVRLRLAGEQNMDPVRSAHGGSPSRAVSFSSGGRGSSGRRGSCRATRRPGCLGRLGRSFALPNGVQTEKLTGPGSPGEGPCRTASTRAAPGASSPLGNSVAGKKCYGYGIRRRLCEGAFAVRIAGKEISWSRPFGVERPPSAVRFLPTGGGWPTFRYNDRDCLKAVATARLVGQR
jgi:hypothetical protein